MLDISNKKPYKNKSFFNKSKRIICNTRILILGKPSTFRSFSNQKKHTEVSLFSKKDKKNLKWFTFLPFETPSLLFLPKMGTVLFYSSSFSMINYF